MDAFEERLAACRGAVERYVRLKIDKKADADDVLQEIYIAAYRNRAAQKSENGFKSWLLGIARNKCGDFYRRRPPVTLVELRDEAVARVKAQRIDAVGETLARLSAADRQLLSLFYAARLPQSEIAARLGLPEGTVKSRLHAARERFRRLYPYPPRTTRGETHNMKKLPEKLPDYTIEWLDEPPFETRCEEMPGWMIVPKAGERLQWGLYELPGRERTEYTEMAVTGLAEVHGELGAEIAAVQHDAENYFRTGSVSGLERRFVVQLTDTHCRVLAESHAENGVRRCFTFLDGEAFLNNWGYGPDNCGVEISLKARGLLRRRGRVVEGAAGPEQTDVVGRCRVTIGGKAYDTVCVMTFEDGIVSESYVDRNGRTVLWRRFNGDDWAFGRYRKRWTDMLPDNERLTVNGQTFVHWYDCITDYIL